MVQFINNKILYFITAYKIEPVSNLKVIWGLQRLKVILGFTSLEGDSWFFFQNLFVSKKNYKVN